MRSYRVPADVALDVGAGADDGAGAAAGAVASVVGATGRAMTGTVPPHGYALPVSPSVNSADTASARGDSAPSHLSGTSIV